MNTRQGLATTLSAVALVISGCGLLDTYVVRTVAPSAGPDGKIGVTCWVKDTAKTREKRWDPLVQSAPVIGERWLCN
jgi:hypothetical protein